MNLKLIALSIIVLCSAASIAQIAPPELEKKIKGKKNLKQIMASVEHYYEQEERQKETYKKTHPALAVEDDEEEFESGLQLWKRWEWWNKDRLKPNGDLEDVQERTLQAWQKVKSKSNAANKIASGTNAAWTFVGPTNMQYQGGLYRGLNKLDRIVFHPTDPNTFYVCAGNGGLWRTTNGGANWNNLNFNFPILSTAGVAIHPTNPNILYVLTGDPKTGVSNSCGIWVTYDGGGNWFKTSFNSNRQSGSYNGFKIIMLPTSTNILLAATYNGLYRSNNSGQTWTAVRNGTFYDVEVDPSNEANIYASGYGSFWKSTDYGATFPSNQSTTVNGATRIEIGVSPANANYVYLLCGPFVATNKFGGVYRSTSKGDANTFSLRTNSPNILCSSSNGVTGDDNDQSGYDLCIDVSKSNPEVLITGGKIIWKSSDGGSSFSNLTLYNEGSYNPAPPANYIHPDIQDIAYNPLNNYLYACTDGGVYRSTNGGFSWTDLTNGIQSATFYHMAAAPFNVNKILGGTQDNGIKYKNGAGDFTHITGADGFDCAFGPSASSYLYCTVNQLALRFDANGNNEQNITPADAGHPGGLIAFFSAIAADPVNNNVVYIAGGGFGIYKSTNGGTSWTNSTTTPIQQSICTCPSNASRVYAGDGGQLIRSDNSGSTWSANLTANAGWNNGSIVDVNVCSGNSSLVYAAIGGYEAGRKVYYSTDAGATWANISGTLPAEVKVNCVVADVNNNAYIGTDVGVFYQGAASTDWTPFFNDLPHLPITDLAINQGSSKIRASTYGGGIWEASLFTTCDADFALPGLIAGEKFYQASNDINATANITGGNQTIVTARAGHEIILADGFTALEQNTFNGVIGSCETSPVYPRQAFMRNNVPAFMSQVHKGNDTTLYPYGYVSVLSVSRTEAAIKVIASQQGGFTIRITNEENEVEFYKASVDMFKGQLQTNVIPMSKLNPGKYFVQLFYEGQLVHVQELIVPPKK